MLFSIQCFYNNPDLHSFPTRRSSDLDGDRFPRRDVEHGDLADVFVGDVHLRAVLAERELLGVRAAGQLADELADRKSTRLNSSHGYISYAVFCLKKKKKN